MSERNRGNEAMQYLYIQMLNDGIIKYSKSQQIQYILDMMSMFNDNKLDMIEDIIDNIKKFGYKEEHVILLYSILLNNITKADSILDTDAILGEYNPTEEIDELVGL